METLATKVSINSNILLKFINNLCYNGFFKIIEELIMHTSQTGPTRLPREGYLHQPIAISTLGYMGHRIVKAGWGGALKFGFFSLITLGGYALYKAYDVRSKFIARDPNKLNYAEKKELSKNNEDAIKKRIVGFDSIETIDSPDPIEYRPFGRFHIAENGDVFVVLPRKTQKAFFDVVQQSIDRNAKEIPAESQGILLATGYECQKKKLVDTIKKYEGYIIEFNLPSLVKTQDLSRSIKNYPLFAIDVKDSNLVHFRNFLKLSPKLQIQIVSYTESRAQSFLREFSAPQYHFAFIDQNGSEPEKY